MKLAVKLAVKWGVKWAVKWGDWLTVECYPCLGSGSVLIHHAWVLLAVACISRACSNSKQ